MKTPTIDQARDAMDEYHAQIRDGGEPDFPQWAFDMVRATAKADAQMREILAGNDTTALVRYLRASPTSAVMLAAADKIEELEGMLAAVGAGGVGAQRIMQS